PAGRHRSVWWPPRTGSPPPPPLRLPRPPGPARAPAEEPLHEGQAPVDREGQPGDEQRGRQDLGRVVGPETGEDRVAEAAGRHQRRHRGHAHRGHGRHPDAADHHRQRQGQPDPPQRLRLGHPHPPGRLDDLGRHRPQSDDGVPQDRQHRVEGEGRHGGGGAEAEGRHQQGVERQAGNGEDHARRADGQRRQPGPAGGGHAEAHRRRDRDEQRQRHQPGVGRRLAPQFGPVVDQEVPDVDRATVTRMTRTAAALLCLVALLGLPHCGGGAGGGGGSGGNAIVVGSKLDTEAQVLGRLMAVQLQAKGYTVRTKIPLGGTEIIRKALTSKRIDVYWEFTGSGLNVLGVPPIGDPPAAYAKVKALDAAKGVTWLPAARLNDTYALAVKGDGPITATTLSQLAGALAGRSDVRLCVDPEGGFREDVLPLLASVYGITFKDTTQLGYELIPPAVAGGRCSAGIVYSTAALIVKNGLRVLDDDR